MKQYAILGWGISARAVYRYLMRAGDGDIRIYLPAEEYRRAYEEDNSLPLVPDSEPLCGDVLVRSPGIRPDTPGILSALAAGAVLTSETELFIEACPAPVYAVTGSDGKTTTATLATRMLEAAGCITHLGGNIGVSLLDHLDVIRPAHRVVLELSSFQLMGYCPSLAGAAVTNLTENHLNWHTDMAEYRRAKMNIFPRARHRVMNARLASGLSAVTFSAEVENANYHIRDGILMHGEEPIIAASAVKLRGIHNTENILCAAALSEVASCHAAEVAARFEGVAHRMSCCGICRGVTCYDASIDTTPARTAVTLAALPWGCTVICGGAGKNLSYVPLASALATYAARVVFTGAVGEEMQAALVAHGGKLPMHCYLSDFSSAVTAALEMTPPGGVLVLSPAATSFDTFSSYRERGEAFCHCLSKLQK